MLVFCAEGPQYVPCFPVVDFGLRLIFTGPVEEATARALVARAVVADGVFRPAIVQEK